MTITIKIDTGNAAFRDSPAYATNYEVSQIMHVVADRFYMDGSDLVPALFDTNGNLVGSVTVKGK